MSENGIPIYQDQVDIQTNLLTDDDMLDENVRASMAVFKRYVERVKELEAERDDYRNKWIAAVGDSVMETQKEVFEKLQKENDALREKFDMAMKALRDIEAEGIVICSPIAREALAKIEGKR